MNPLDSIRKYRNEHDAMTRSFRKAVSRSIESNLAAGHPVARYDKEKGKPYLEYPDGRIQYV